MIAALFVDPRGSIARRFWPKVRRSGPVPPHATHLGECWEWTASIGSSGYGQLGTVGDRPERAHRIAYALAYGHVPEGFLVCHLCDNRRCVRPNHLFLGTHLDNVRDMDAKGRSRRPRAAGERNGSAKLTAVQVREIKSALELGGRQAAIARSYGVSRHAVHLIAKGKKWAHL